ncbi:MAG: 30S ribosomal protein S12 methylthiotransferase RimO [Bacteroides sp.]|nr:30S ribosomal protein S12 methylthiotransferase RimO [Bacteroides sp.]
MATRKVNIVSLGCSKNLIDSERLMKLLADAGFGVVHNAELSERNDVTIINTCGFIGDAKEESINMILSAVKAKEEGLTDKLFVMGCLSERYRKELPEEIENVDGWYGKTDWAAIVGRLASTYPATAPYDRIITTPRHHAYVKIAEGCNRFCAFCAIPLITGRYKSRPEEEVLKEVKTLVGRGVKEFNIIAQDLSYYGKDLDGTHHLASLVDRMASIEGVEWIRLHYAYPSDFPYEILDVMSRRSNVCNYMDIALQHVSDKVLCNMRRHINREQTYKLLDEIRAKVPGIHIRTTLMVGFPGEGEKEFEELLQFVKDQRFERMGAFAYCEEDDTYAAKNFSDDIPEEVKADRLDRLMALQEEIAYEHQLKKLGTTIRVIIDCEEADYYIGRTEFDSPEVDPEVLVEKDRKLDMGEFYNVVIKEALPFELIGRVVD